MHTQPIGVDIACVQCRYGLGGLPPGGALVLPFLDAVAGALGFVLAARFGFIGVFSCRTLFVTALAAQIVSLAFLAVLPRPLFLWGYLMLPAGIPGSRV